MSPYVWKNLLDSPTVSPPAYESNMVLRSAHPTDGTSSRNHIGSISDGPFLVVSSSLVRDSRMTLYPYIESH